MKTNRELTGKEFIVVSQLKRAVVDVHNGNYNDAEEAVSKALKFLYNINK